MEEQSVILATDDISTTCETREEYFGHLGTCGRTVKVSREGIAPLAKGAGQQRTWKISGILYDKIKIT